MSDARRLPSTARGLIALTLLAGTTLVLAQGLHIGGWEPLDVATLLGLIALIAIGEMFQFEVPYRTERATYSVTDGIWTAGLFLAKPSVLTLAVAGGVLLGQGVQPWAKIKVLFNAAQFVVGIIVATSVFEALGSPSATEPFGWAAAAIAMGTFQVVNTLLVGAVISSAERLPFWRVALVPTGVLHWIGNLAIGVLGALLWTVEPLALPLLIVPLAMVFFAYRGWLRTTQERDAMRDMARTADEIGQGGDIAKRVDPPGAQDAAAALASTLNRMLERIEAGFQRERRFIRETSHELRTPITIVQGHLEVLSPEPDREEIAETTKLVLDEMDRMARIVEDMSLLARVEDPATLRVETVRVDAFLTEVGNRASGLLGGQLRVVPPPPISTCADPQRLTQAVMNLLTNARDHTPPGTPVELRVREAAGAVRFEVSDRGTGLEPTMEKTIFRPYDKGRESLGSGLGLAVVAGVARAHGGSAGVDNRPGYGATFWLEVAR